MAKKSDKPYLENANIKITLLNYRFTLLVSLLMTIIILLCMLIIVLMTSNYNYASQIFNNETNYSVAISNTTENETQISGSSHKMIYRNTWGGRPALYERPQKLPVKYVIISHTAGTFCDTITSCSQQMQSIQQLHINLSSPDIGYNFLIGGDGNIYVARGWDNHNFHLNLDTIGISFMGNYLYNKLTPDMIEATHHLLKEGVKKEKLDKEYILVAHNQTWNTQSPGPNVYNQISFWPHFSKEPISDIEI